MLHVQYVYDYNNYVDLARSKCITPDLSKCKSTSFESTIQLKTRAAVSLKKKKHVTLMSSKRESMI